MGARLAIRCSRLWLALCAGGNLKHLLTLVFMLVLVACDNSTVVEKRTRYWKNELERTVPIGTSKEQAIKLLQAIDPNSAEDLRSGSIESKFETVETNTVPCKSFVITGTTKLTNSIVSGHTIVLTGNCL